MTAFSISATIEASLSIKEVLASDDSPAAVAAELQKQFNAYNKKYRVTGSSSPKIDKPAVDLSKTLSGSSATIDLTAAPTARDINVNVDLSSSRWVCGLIYAATTNNASGLTFGFGASNPYPLFGASKEIIMLPGELVLIGFQGGPSAKPLVSGTVKTLDLAGTTADVLTIIALFGTAES